MTDDRADELAEQQYYARQQAQDDYWARLYEREQFERSGDE